MDDKGCPIEGGVANSSHIHDAVSARIYICAFVLLKFGWFGPCCLFVQVFFSGHEKLRFHYASRDSLFDLKLNRSLLSHPFAVIFDNIR